MILLTGSLAFSSTLKDFVSVAQLWTPVTRISSKLEQEHSFANVISPVYVFGLCWLARLANTRFCYNATCVSRLSWDGPWPVFLDLIVECWIDFFHCLVPVLCGQFLESLVKPRASMPFKVRTCQHDNHTSELFGHFIYNCFSFARSYPFWERHEIRNVRRDLPISM